MGAACWAAAGGCGTFPPEHGPAFAPWSSFPDDELPPDLRAVGGAILAASPHNTQPWAFELGPGRIDIVVDDERNIGAMDPYGRERRIGVGCAIENLLVAARSFGLHGEPTWLPDPRRPELLARVDYVEREAVEHALLPAIATRHTARGAYLDAPLADGVADELVSLVGDLEPVELVVLTAASDREAFRSGTIAATRAIVDDDEMMGDSDAWYRHTEQEIAEHRDGVTLDASGLGAATRVFGKAGKRPTPERSGKFWISATEGRQTTGSAFGILSAPELDDSLTLVAIGRAWQRIHLWLTLTGWSAQPLNQMLERRDRELSLGLAPTYGDRLVTWTGNDRFAQLAFRVGLCWEEPRMSPRRPLEWVVEET